MQNNIKKEMFYWLDKNKELLRDVAQKIWDKPETAFIEKFASSLQLPCLKKRDLR